MDKWGEKLREIQESEVVFKPNHLRAMTHATLTAAHDSNDNEGYGMQVFVQQMVTTLTKTKSLGNTGEKILSEENQIAISLLPIKAKDFGNFFYIVFSSAIEVEEMFSEHGDLVEDNEMVRGFLTAATACLELTYNGLNDKETHE